MKLKKACYNILHKITIRRNLVYNDIAKGMAEGSVVGNTQEEEYLLNVSTLQLDWYLPLFTPFLYSIIRNTLQPHIHLIGQYLFLADKYAPKLLLVGLGLKVQSKPCSAEPLRTT